MALTAEQLARRVHGIGSSEAGAAIGIHPYSSQVELWLEKIGRVPHFQGNNATKWGNLLEPAVRQEYAEQTDRVVRLPDDTLVHPTIPFMLCHPDGITDDGRLYEGKTARFPDGFGEPGTDEVPEHYLIQVQHGLIVTGLEVADLCVLIGGQDFRMYEIPADRELQQSIIDAEAEFWGYVERQEQPPVDLTSDRACEVLRKLYKGTNGQTVLATDVIDDWRTKLQTAQAQEKQAQASIQEAKANLLNAMGEAALLKFPNGESYRRSLINRKGYTVAASSYIDARFIAS